ncbi:B12-binding domain-containing radical SAM protein [Candidatus Omnitrophota bacterium]
MKKVILIYPRRNYSLVSGNLEPLGVQYLASSLIKEGQEVEIIDFTFDPSLERLKKCLDSALYVGFSFTTPLFNRAVEILNYIKSIKKDLVSIAGGPHPTIDCKSVLDGGFDFAAIGEGEAIIKEFTKNIYNKNTQATKGVAFKLEGKVVMNEPPCPIENIDEIPFPGRDLIDYSLYDSVGMIASRGCRYNCLYCQPTLRRIFGKHLRERSVDNLVNEIEMIKRKFPKKRYRFEDDTFTNHDKEWFKKFKDELVKRKINFQWQCNSRVDTINIEKAKIMKECGCRQIGFGVESGSAKVQNLNIFSIALD